MAANIKKYIYTKATNAELDADFTAASAYSKVRPGKDSIFWKSGFRWYSLPYADIQRIFRRVETIHGKLCCGGHTFIIEWLVLILHDGTEIVVHIGDNETKKAQALLAALKEIHPEIAYGKV